MKRFSLPLALLSLTLAGCGGSLNKSPDLGIKVVYDVAPSKASTSPGGTLGFAAFVVEGGYSDLAVSVREGAAGGTANKTTSGTRGSSDGPLPDGVAYVAPSAPGTYHIDVEFLSGTSVEAMKTATVTVTAMQ